MLFRLSYFKSILKNTINFIIMAENKLTTNELAVKRPQEYKEVMNKAKLKQLEYLQHNESVKKLLGQIDSMLLEMDNMMTHDIFRHKLKASAKNFVRELEAWNSANFHDAVKSNTIESTNEYINEHEQIQEIFQSIHTDYRPHLINLLNKFVESGYDTEAVSKRVAKEQFTLLKDFFAPDLVKKQLKRIDKDIFEYNVMHVNEVLTREKVMSLPKIDKLTIEFLEKLFNYCRLKW